MAHMKSLTVFTFVGDAEKCSCSNRTLKTIGVLMLNTKRLILFL